MEPQSSEPPSGPLLGRSLLLSSFPHFAGAAWHKVVCCVALMYPGRQLSQHEERRWDPGSTLMEWKFHWSTLMEWKFQGDFLQVSVDPREEAQGITWTLKVPCDYSWATGAQAGEPQSRQYRP